MQVPDTLHGQLYLLAYDRKRRHFQYDSDVAWKTRWRFGFALKSAMLTDLYLTGYVQDKDGKADRANSASIRIRCSTKRWTPPPGGSGPS